MRLAVERIFAVVVPGAATEEERPQVRIVEGKRQRDGLPELRQRLVGRDLNLAPHRTRSGGSKGAPQDAHPNGKDRRFGWGTSTARHTSCSLSGGVCCRPPVYRIPGTACVARSPLRCLSIGNPFSTRSIRL